MKGFLKRGLPAGILSCVLMANSTIAVLAAPTELYGYKKMDLIEFHKVVYDKHGNPRIFPKNKTFKTTTESTDTNSSASKHNNGVTVKKVKRSVDALASASQKGGKDDKGGVDAVGGASGGFVAADVVFDFELISNAIILHNLGIKNESVERILAIWSTSTKTVVAKDNTEEGYDWEDFVNKAADAYANGQDLTFEEYTKLNNKKVAKLPPSAKYILEDGTFGTRIDRKEIGGKEAPYITNDNKNNKLNSDIVFGYTEDKAWKDAIESITVGKEDYNKKKLLLSDVKFEGNKITIDKKYFKLGENVITISAKGYKTAVITQFVYKDKVELVAKEGKVGQDIILAADTKEYLKDIKFINLNGRVLDQEKGEWKIVNDSIVLSKSLFNKEGDYKILINTDNKYDLKLLNIKVTKDGINKDGVDTEKKVLPTIASVEVNKNEDIIFTFKTNKPWQKAITKIEKVEESGIAPLNEKLEYRVSDGSITIPQGRALNNPGEYLLRIFAEGYEPLDVKATVVKEHPEVLITYIPRVNDEVKFKINDNGYRWIDNLHEIFVNGKKLDKTLYHTAGNLVVIHEKVLTLPGTYSILMKSKGFTNAVKQIAVLEGNGANEETNLKDAPELMAKQNILSKNEELIVTVNDLNWKKELKIVQVNGNKVNDFTIKDKNITIPSKYFKEGNNTVEMLSTGYRKAFLSIALYKTVPNDVKAFEAKEGFDMMIDIGADRDYVISQVILNGKTLKENEDYSMSALRMIVIKKNIIKVGNNEVTIKADRYYDKSFTIDVKKKETPKPVEPKPEELPSAKAMLWRHSVDKGSTLELDKTNENYKVDSISFNGKEVGFKQDKTKITPDSSSLDAGNYEIIVKAKGYKDGNFTIIINKKKDDPKKEEVKPEQPKPEIKKLRANLWLGQIEQGRKIKIEIGNSEEISNISLISNGKPVSFVKEGKSLIVDTTNLDLGENKLLVKADGYEDAKLSIKVYSVSKK